MSDREALLDLAVELVVLITADPAKGDIKSLLTKLPRTLQIDLGRRLVARASRMKK